jgi:uncharacterized protein
MSGTSDPEGRHGPGQGASADPSMEDILASIRRILNEDPSQADEALDPPAHQPPQKDVLVLDASMMTTPEAAEPEPDPVSVMGEPAFHVPEPAPFDEPPPTEPEPPRAVALEPAPVMLAPEDRLLAPETAEAAGNAMSQLAAAVAAQRQSLVYRGGPTLEDMVREELRPLLKAWLDTHLPPLVERLVRAEIDRLGVGRAP